MKTSVEILREAKALIPDEAHWWRGLIIHPDTNPDVACCAITAISRAHGGRDEYRLLEEAVAVPMGHIPRWNDAPERTYSEVMEAFDKAIALAEDK